MLNFIINPKSGRGKGFKTLKKLACYCNKVGTSYTLHITNSKGHATKIAQALVENGATTIVAVGGDGTFHEVLNGISSFEKTTLGFIPCGRGNDFARAAKISTNPIKALKNILSGETTYIDYIDVSGVKCLNAAGTGLDISVLERVDNKSGKLSYLKATIYCLKHFSPYDINYTRDGQSLDARCILIAVCNGKTIGSNLKVSPLSEINDGLLNVVIIKVPQNGRILSVLPKFVKGKHIDLPVTEHFLCDNIDIGVMNNQPIQLDGEIYRDLKFSCRIVKNGLRTFSVVS